MEGVKNIIIIIRIGISIGLADLKRLVNCKPINPYFMGNYVLNYQFGEK